MNRGNFAIEHQQEAESAPYGMRDLPHLSVDITHDTRMPYGTKHLRVMPDIAHNYGKGFEDFTRNDLRDIILHKNKVIADLEEHAYGSASWIDALNKGLKRANEIKKNAPPKESDEDFRKRLEGFDREKDAPTENWGADELNGGATPAEPKVSPVAAAAAVLQPVRTAIQNGIGDAIYGKSDDPKKQKKGLLGISEEGKEESKKKVMKNIVVPIVKAANQLKTNIEDTANQIFNKDKYDADMKERRIKQIKKEEAEAGIVRDKENPMIIIRKPRGMWKADTTDPEVEAYNRKRVLRWNRGAKTQEETDKEVYYIRVPNPIFAAKLKPSFKEFGDAGVKLWTGVEQLKKGESEDVDGTLKQLQDDPFIFIPEDRAKEIYGQLRQFVADKQDEGVMEGYEDEGWTKGQLKAFAKIDPRTLKGQDLIDWKESKLALDKVTTQNALDKVKKDIKDEEAKATPDQTRLGKMREAKVRVENRQKELSLRGQQEFKDMMMFSNAEKAKRDAEYYARQKADAEGTINQADADKAEFDAKPVAERIAILESYKEDSEGQTLFDLDEQIEQLRAQEASEKVEQQAQGSVDLLQQAQVIGAGGGDDTDDDDTSVEDIDIIRIDMGKGLVYFVDAPKKNAKGKLVGLPFSSLKEALSSPLGIGNRRVFDADSEEEVGNLKDPLYKKLAMKVFNMEKEWRAENLKKLGFAMDEDEDEDELEGAGAVEYTLNKAGMRLFNPSGDRSKAAKQSFTPDYDAYGETIEQGRLNAFNLSRSMYDQSKAIELPDFKLIQDDTSLRFYRKEDDDVILVGIRGTDVKSWTDLYTWAVIGVSADLRMTTRFQEDLAKLVAFQRNYPPSQFYYVGTGSSLAGSIADRFLEMGLLEEAITYNPSIEKKHLLDENILNHRVYLDTDPLFILMGQYSPNTEIRVNPNKTNYYNPSKEKDYLIASHSIYPVYNPAFEGGGMEGSGKTYTLEEWKEIFDAKLEQKRKAIEAREAKKKQTAKAKRERAKGRRDEREKPKEPEPEPELEVTQFTIDGQIILVEDDDAGEKRFLDRRVFNDDSEEIGTLGSLTPEKLRKLVVERVQRAEKRGEFAPEVVFSEDEEDDDDDEPPPLEAPFRTSRVQKATPPKGEPKKRKPRFKIVAPASARVELREELVAEQPRTEKGKFAEEAETAVVAVSQAPQQAYMRLMKSPAFTVADRKLLTRIRETKMSPRMRAVLLGRSGLARKVMEMMGLDESAFQTQRGQLRIMDKVEKRVEKTRVREAIDPPASFRDEFRAIIDAHREMPSKEKAKIIKKLLPSVEKYRKQHTQYERVGDRGAVRAILDRTYTEMKFQASLSAPLLKDELYRSQMTTWFDDVLHLEVRRNTNPIKLYYNELSPRGYKVYVSKMVRPNGQVFELSKFDKEFFARKYEGRREVDSDWDKMRKEGDLTDGEKSFIGRLKEDAEIQISKYGYAITGREAIGRFYLREFIQENYKFFTPREWCDDRVFEEWLGLPLFYTKPYQYWDDPWVGISDANPNGRKPTLYKETEEKIASQIKGAEKRWDFVYWRKMGGAGSLAFYYDEWSSGRKKGESSYDPLMRN